MIVGPIQSWFSSDYVARVVTDRVQLFSLSKQECLLDFGRIAGKGISVEMSGGDSSCFVGAYDAWGVARFDLQSRKEMWRRKDLKRVQNISCGMTGSSIYVSFTGVGAQQLDFQTGETAKRFRGVSEVYASPSNDALVLENKKAIHITRADGESIVQAKPEGFAILDVAWSPASVLISEARDADSNIGGVVRCFSLSNGGLLWKYVSQRSHVQPISYRPAREAFVGVDYVPGPDSRLILQWDASSGTINYQKEIPVSMHGRFCQRGEALVKYRPPDIVFHKLDELK